MIKSSINLCFRVLLLPLFAPMVIGASMLLAISLHSDNAGLWLRNKERRFLNWVHRTFPID